jgi:hypothetical protein
VSVPPARPPTELFDWKRVCPDDVARVFAPIVGKGRGEELNADAVLAARRKMRDHGLTPPAPPT